MKRMKSFAPVFIVLLIVGAIGCSNEDFGLNSQELSLLETDEFAVVDYEDAVANVEDATLERSMVMNPVFQNGGPGGFGPGGRGGFSPHGRHPGHRGSHLKRILRQLDLSEEQFTQVRELMASHREAVQPIFEQIREINAPIIEEANAQRQAILEAARNGDITREEAREQLKALSEATRDAIRNNPDTEDLRAQLCDAKASLFDSVRALLTEEQQAQWDDWVGNVEGPCSGE